jgi:hypothetical protein
VRSARDVISGQQNLTDGEVVRRERETVGGDQSPLTDAGGCLLGGQITRATQQPQRPQAGRYGTGGDKDDLSALTAALRDHVDERAEPVEIQDPACGGQRAGADLDDKSLGGAQISVTGREHP